VSWKKYFKSAPVSNPSGAASPLSNMSSSTSSDPYRNYQSQLPEVYVGHPNRLERYNQYEQMDMDSEINTSLDIISEFSTQSNIDNDTAFDIVFHDDPTDTEVNIIKEQLRNWNKLNKWDSRIFKLFRNTIKYGDQLFIRDPETFELMWVEMSKVIRVIVNESKGKEPEQYIIKDLAPNLQNLTATQVSASDTFANHPQVGGPNGAYIQPRVPYGGGSRFQKAQNENAINAEHVVHLSLTEGLDVNWPFGNSILEQVFKVFKQKELLEDAIIIYRVQRAPERRVFKIDVGNMPSHLAMSFVERIKNEIWQRRIPTQGGGGQNVIDGTYNPISMLEDYFFPMTADGRGSSVETLPGGCLAMDTQVLLLDGRSLSIRDLAEEYRQGKTNWTYSTNPETGEVVPGIVSWAGVTHKSAKVLRLTLDNGKQIVCTPDHKFPILGKGLVRADELIIGESFIPCNIKNQEISKHSKRQYTQIYQNNTKKWQFVHRMVAKHIPISALIKTKIFNEEYAEKEKSVIHHVDHNRFNNNPENLVLMNFWDHQEYHSFHGFSAESQQLGTLAARKKLENLKKNDPEEYQKLIDFKKQQLKNWRKSQTPEYWENHCNKISQAIKDYFQGLSPEERSQRAEISAQNALLATAKVQELLSTDEEFRENYVRIHQEGFEKFRSMPHYRERNEKIAAANVQRYQNPEYKERVFKNQRIKYDKFLLDAIQSLVQGKTTHEVSTTNVVDHVNHTEYLLNHFLELNKDTKCANWSNDKFTKNQLMQLVKQQGYKSWRHFRSESDLYNHKLISVEVLSEPIEVGTLTIDVEEKYHSYHNFALEVGVFTQNSNLGEIDDLRFFTNKMFRGLRIPSSYMPTGPDDSERSFNDGKVGTALIQEWRFNQYCKRLQNMIVPKLDREFKMFLRWRGVNIDNSLFDLKFNEPQNFYKYRQNDIDSVRIQSFTQLEQLPYLSKRFMLERFLGLSEEEINRNEQLWREEKDEPEEMSLGDVGLRPLGITPGAVDADLGDFDSLEAPAGAEAAPPPGAAPETAAPGTPAAPAPGPITPLG
jgi:hypothetical protein